MKQGKGHVFIPRVLSDVVRVRVLSDEATGRTDAPIGSEVVGSGNFHRSRGPCVAQQERGHLLSFSKRTVPSPDKRRNAVVYLAL